MKVWIVAYLSAGTAMLALDAVWLNLVGAKLYRPRLGHLMADQVNYVPAALFYLIYLVGVVTLAIQPALADGRWTTAAVRGGLVGLCAYAAYDLTNHATLKNWPLTVTLADLTWGTMLTAAVASVGYWAAARVAG